MMSNGNLAWFMNGREIDAPTDNNSNRGANHLKRSLDTMEQGAGPRRPPNARGAIDGNRNQRMRSDSNLAANLVTEVNDLITPYDYCLGYPDFLDYYVDQLSFLNAEQRSWFPDYLGRYFDMIETADAEWGQDDYAERYGDYISPYDISEKYLVDMSRVYVCALTTIVTDGSNTTESSSTSNTTTQSTVSTTAVTSEAIAQLDFSTIIANLRQFSLNPELMSRVGEAEMELIRGVYELVQSKSTVEEKEEAPIKSDTNNESHEKTLMESVGVLEYKTEEEPSEDTLNKSTSDQESGAEIVTISVELDNRRTEEPTEDTLNKSTSDQESGAKLAAISVELDTMST